MIGLRVRVSETTDLKRRIFRAKLKSTSFVVKRGDVCLLRM